jgi:hypothetical protein
MQNVPHGTAAAKNDGKPDDAVFGEGLGRVGRAQAQLEVASVKSRL